MPIQNITHHYEEEYSDDDADLKKYIKVCVCKKNYKHCQKIKKQLV